MSIRSFSMPSRLLALATAAATLALAACGGGADPADSNDAVALEKPDKYSVGGTISGLAPDNDGLALTPDSVNYDTFTANGPFTLSKRLPKGATYNVGWFAPSGYTCNVTNGSGTIKKSNVTNVLVSCAPLVQIALKYSVTGLPAGLSVSLNFGGFPLGVVNTNGTFDIANFPVGTQYIFGVTTQTPGAGCSVPPDDVFGFLAETPNPRILAVNCGVVPAN
jgi:hypothetical protein